MKAEQLLREGKLEEALEMLSAHLREYPDDRKARTFLFELLCFSGEYDRAEIHLNLLGEPSQDAALGALLYRRALNAERTRREMFERGEYPRPLDEGSSRISGSLNGSPFQLLTDTDPRIGPRLEVFAAGDYLWIPFAHIASVEIAAPRRLRDLLWATARIRVGPEFERRDEGEVLLPVLSPLTFQHPDAPVRLGRVTEWCADEQGGEAPFGQKMLQVDGNEVPFLEIRRLEIQVAGTATSL
jgi:type VI secretion system protein ImpE